MEAREEVSRVRSLSDRELLAGLSGVVGSSRKLVALLVVHLGEVEKRRLHLLAGQGSMFAYCTERLGMSEDEACRRIEVARLARRFPILFERLATGRVSLSVAALLKAHLTESNHVALLDAVAGKTVKLAREVLAAWFPRPDVASSIRKLPERRARATVGSGGDRRASSDAPSCEADDDVAIRAPSEASAPRANASEPKSARPVTPERLAVGTPKLPSPVPGDASTSDLAGTDPREPCGAGTPDTQDAPVARVGAVHSTASDLPVAEESPTARQTAAEQTTPLPRATAPARTDRASAAIEPLSPGRYKIVFTADADLKRKLDLARDLLRHAVPDGDLPAIIGRALDLLLEKTIQRRFAMTTRRRKPHSPAAKADATSGVSTTRAPTAERIDAKHAALQHDVRSTPDTAPSAVAANDPVSSGASAGAKNQGEPATTMASDRPSVTSPRPMASHDSAIAPRPPSAPPITAPKPAREAEARASSRPLSTPPTPEPPPVQPPPPQSSHLSNPTRRAVLERDGLRCAWMGPDGVRCESRAWLEHDHIVPRGLGGDDEPSNIRVCCRAHNRLAAEQAYGQPAIARIIARRRARKGHGRIADVNGG